jgi:tripartite-type tricarboxylate transporter receptor subunit TctC
MTLNTNPRRLLIQGLSGLAAAALTPLTSWAQTAFPSKPMTFVVPYPAGGANDMLGRLIGQKMSEALSATSIVDNKPGAAALLGASVVARAAADGHTLLIGGLATHAASPYLLKADYDPLKDFAPVSLVALTHSLLLTHPSLPVKTVRELIDYAKTNPGKLNYASGTNGSSAHIGSELLKLMAGIDIVRVPYKGTAENLNALLANEVQVSFVTLPAALPLISSGRLRVLALGGPRRVARLPDVPTLAETLPGYDIGTWHGVLAPAGTPAAIIARMSSELAKMAKNHELREQAAAQGLELVGSTPQELDVYIRGQIVKFGKMVKATGMRVD